MKNKKKNVSAHTQTLKHITSFERVYGVVSAYKSTFTFTYFIVDFDVLMIRSCSLN